MTGDVSTSYLPAPKQYVLAKMSEMETAEMIESFVDYYDPKTGRSVHLPSPFVRHYMKRDDGALATVVTIAQLPIILADGGVLALGDNDVDRERGILFCIPPELLACLPTRAECSLAAVTAALRFVLEEWLCDVKTTFIGKCAAVAAALSIIERSLLDNRPCFFVTAGRRGTGKTTLLHMLVMAVLGIPAPAAAWSTNEEERRKALFSYLMAGVAFIIWDNIARGAQISCPHVEKACTSAYYTDRKLGVSETVAAAASAIQLFTGNNVGPKGDLASRASRIILEADRADPENRPVKHPNPILWTEAHRGLTSAPSIRSCSATRGSIRRSRTQAKPGSRSGGAWLAPRSNTPRHSTPRPNVRPVGMTPAASWTSRPCSSPRKRMTKRAPHWPTHSQRSPASGRQTPISRKRTNSPPPRWRSLSTTSRRTGAAISTRNVARPFASSCSRIRRRPWSSPTRR
jgi:hypothetical protein